MRFDVITGSSTVATALRSNVHPVNAVSNGLGGYLEGELGRSGAPDLKQPHRAHLELPVRSLKSGNRIEDMEMERRMDVRRYPNIVADVQELKPLGAGKYRATAELNVRGNSKTVQANVSIAVTGSRVVVETEHIFDMREFGIDPPRVLMLRMEPEVRVKVHTSRQSCAPPGAGLRPPSRRDRREPRNTSP